MGRTPCCSKVGLRRGSWSAKEDELLTKYIQAHGEGKWRSLPEKAGLLRCGKSCRLRWKNYLSPGIKRGDITPDEEDLIIRLHSLLGNRWSLIAGRLPARTDNEIKNHWNTQLAKRLSKSDNSLQMEKDSKKAAKRKQEDSSMESDNGSTRSKPNYNNPSSFCSGGSEAVTKIKVHVPKPIRVLPRLSSNHGTRHRAMNCNNSTSPKEEVNNKEANNKAQLSLSAFSSLVELGDANYYSSSEVAGHGQHVLFPDGEFSFEDLLAGRVPEAVSFQDILPASSHSVQEKTMYDEYLQLF